jgi:type I restriction enzyme S subunit
MMSKKSPQLRFEGFTDDWEERKLSDIADRFDNLRVPITASDRKPGDTPYYGANGIQDYVEGFTHNGEFILVAEDGANDLKNYPVQYVNGKVWVNNHAHVLQGKKTITDNKFLMNAIKNFNIEPFLVGGGRAKLNADVMMKLNILLPTFVEQEKIGSLFSLLDKTIALHQRKLDLLKEQKKGYLQKMFPKNGAKVPELRFAGFADDWEERKLGELLKSAYQGINTAGDKVIYSEKGVEILQSKHITSGYITFDDTRFLDKKRYSGYFPKYVPKKHDILFANIGTIGPSTVVETNKEFLIAWNILKMTPNENVNSKFIELFLQILNEKHYYEKITTGNATKFVNKDAILNIELCISSFKEQQKIGSFFQQLDNTIALHQRKLDLLKEQKKGFLQKMFV